MPTMLAIGAGAGLLKSELVDKPKENYQRKLAAATQRYSPWTGLKAGPIELADPLGSALQYGTTGAQMGNAYNMSQAQQGWLNRGGSPTYTASMNGNQPAGYNGLQPDFLAGPAGPYHL